MSESTEKLRSKRLSRAVIASASLLAMFIAGRLVLGLVEKIRDDADRAT